MDAVADAIGFLLIVLLVAGLANLAGALLQKALHGFGLGCLDMLGGALLGFAQGLLLVVVCMLVTLAFFPQAHWLAEAKLPRFFFGSCAASTCISPDELGARVHDGLRLLEHESPSWMHPGNGVL